MPATCSARTPGQAGAHLPVDLGLGLPRLALGQRLADAHDRRHARAEHGLHLAVHPLVGLAEELAALRVADDHELHGELGQHRRGHLARERALRLPVAVLGAEQDRDAVGVEHASGSTGGR